MGAASVCVCVCKERASMHAYGRGGGSMPACMLWEGWRERAGMHAMGVVEGACRHARIWEWWRERVSMHAYERGGGRQTCV